MTSPHPLQVLQTSATSTPGRPCIVWYGDGGRIELSTASTWNYAVKAANLVTQEWDLQPGARVHLALPAHWQTAGLVLGMWLAGVVVTDDEERSLTITTDSCPDASTAHAVTALDPWGGPSARALPGEALDLGRELRAQPDVLLQPTSLDSSTPALERAGRVVEVSDVSAGASVLPTRVGLVTHASVLQLPDALPMLAAHAASGGALVMCPESMQEMVTSQDDVAAWM